MVDPDAQSVARCKRGDREALELLFRRYVDRVWRYGWSVTRSRESAGEIVQETFLRVMNSIAKFESRSTFATWLFAITRSATMDFVRRVRTENRRRADVNVLRLITDDEVREVRREIPIGEESEAAEHGAGADKVATHVAIHDAIAKLSGAQRDAIVLCEIVGMSIAAVSEILGWSESRVKVTLCRARRRLRELLSGEANKDSGNESAESRDAR